MPLSRRTFVTDSALLSFLPALLAQPELARAMTASAATASPATKPTAGESYWANLYKPADQRGSTAGAPNPERDVRFLHFGDKAGLRWAEDIKLQELPSFSEDAVVTLELGGFRAGSLDTSKMAHVKFAQLHLSCQRVSSLDFFGPLAWATLATVFADKAQKLPSVTDLSALPAQKSTPAAASAVPTTSTASQVNRILLSKGAGQMSVNVTTTPPTSLLDKILSTTIAATKIIAPLLSFPAISLPALQAFYAFYGKLEQAMPSDFLLNTAQKDIVVTQQGTDNENVSAKALKLLAGTYILVPKAHENEVAGEMDKLAAADGYLVPKDAPSKMTSDTRVASAVPTVSYVSVIVKVQPLSSFTKPS